MRVVLIKGESRYEALRLFLDEIGAAFAARGFEVVTVDGPAEPDLHAALARVAGRPTTLIFTFGILGDYRDPDGRTLGQVFDAPHVLQYVDYPLSNWVALDRTAADTALLMIDETHVETVAAIYGPERFAFLGFSPHGGMVGRGGAPAAAAADAADFAKDRPIPILFAGSYYEPQAPWWESQAPAIVSIFRRAVDVALAHDDCPALAALDLSLREHGLDPSGPDVGEFRKLATHVHEHVRTHRRRLALETAAALGLPLHVYGHGFEPHRKRFGAFVFGGEVTTDEVTQLMRRARLVLNVNANFVAGSHERPLMAMLAGAAAASDASRFYSNAFAAGEMAIYRWSALADDLAEIGRLAEDPEALHRMAAQGRARAAAGHRWAHRIDTILAAAKVAAARAGPQVS